LNYKFLQALDAKEYVLKIQAVILGKFTAKENLLKGVLDVFKVEVTSAKFTERMKELEEVLLILKY
jgi:hypothetical protein